MSPSTPSSRPLRSAAVHDELRAQILGGTLRPGDAIGSERVLAERFACNRHAVREAVKRLQQAGLVAVTHGGATRVLDWQAHGGLELLADVAPLLTGADRLRTLRSVAEMRASVGVDAARLCAAEAPEELRAGLPAIVDRLQATADFTARLELYERLWLRIVAGSGNVAYRLAFNSLVAAREHEAFSTAIYATELDRAAAIHLVADAIAAGDPEAAAAAARSTLGRTVDAVRALADAEEV